MIDRLADTNGRFAPSPTGDLHLGNLRTALLAWLFARSTGSSFVIRMEDLDRVTSSVAREATQLRDLAALGIDWDGDVVRQSERFDRYRDALHRLEQSGQTYRCWCTRREIHEAVSAPHGPGAEGRYPGTCRDLDPATINAHVASGRPFAIRLRRQVDEIAFDDKVLGPQRWPVEDLVLCRNDGVPAYNLAVVVDDAAQDIDLVVRGADLLSITSSQLHLASLLHLPLPGHAHVPMVFNQHGQRLTKRDGAVTLTELAAAGRSTSDVLSFLAHSVDQLPEATRASAASELLAGFSPEDLPAEPTTLSPATLVGTASL